MTVIKYDVSDVEAGGEHVQPATYKGKIQAIQHREKKTDGTPVSDLEVVVHIAAGFLPLWTYIKLPDDEAFATSAWKLKEFTQAIGLPAKGSIDTKKLKQYEGKPIIARVIADTDRDGNYRPRIKNLLKPGSVATEEPVAAEAPEPEEGEGEGMDYSEWTTEDLKAELEGRDLKVTGRYSDEKAIAVLEEYDAEQGGEEAEETEETEGNGLPEEYANIDEWDADDLKEELKNLDLKVEGRFSVQKARDLIIEHVSANGGGAEGEAEAPGDEYDEWTVEDLKEEVDSRNEQGAEIEVKGRVSKDKLITALREDDKLAEPF